MKSWVEEAQSKIEANSIPEPNSGCWIWMGSVLRERKPYGRVSFQKKSWAAHRLSYSAYVGPIPSTLWVLHRCDNPSCVNPAHMFLGTSQDNVDDRNRKGRQAKGPKQGAAKLTYEQAEAIRTSKLKLKDLARQYGMAIASIASIKNGESYVR